jgi:hypothetical protein
VNDADLMKQATDDVRRMSTGMTVMGGSVLVAVATVFAARLIAAAIREQRDSTTERTEK